MQGSTAAVYQKVVSVDSKESCECFYCHEVGHLITNCHTLKRKAGRKENFLKSVALVENSFVTRGKRIYKLFERVNI